VTGDDLYVLRNALLRALLGVKGTMKTWQICSGKFAIRLKMLQPLLNQPRMTFQAPLWPLLNFIEVNTKRLV